MIYIELKNLSISFRKNLIFSNLNLTIKRGERIGIIGKNGSGKTTLIETIVGVNNPKTTGEILYFNDIKKHIRAVFQESSYDKSMQLKHLYWMYSMIVGIEPRKDLETMFSYYDLKDKMNSKYYKLSGGQKQKFKLLMCLELKPKLLVLDEVTTALDYEWRKEIFKVLNTYLEANPDCTLILISHNFKELERLTTKHYLIENKNLRLVDNLKEIFDE